MLGIPTGRVRSSLLGAWRLASWRSVSEGQESSYLPPLGLAEDCGGYLIYTDSGHMSVTMSLKDRPPFADISLDAGTPQQKAEAFATYINYCGTFEVNEDNGEVVHQVQFAMQPSLVGQRLRRICIFAGGNLRLDTPQVKIGGKWQSGYIEWTRCSDSPGLVQP
jgi:hypothetical protein